MRLSRAVAAAALCLGVAEPGTAQGSPASEAGCVVVSSERFTFHSHPFVNLHHFLYQWARGVAPPAPDDRRRPVEVRERGERDELAGEERAAWDEAVAYYSTHLVRKDLLFTRELVALKSRLTALPCSGSGAGGLEEDLGKVLARAWPTYRARWWPGHDAANRAWIEEQGPRLASYESTLSRRLADKYGGRWPEDAIRVDVTVYANWAGAYTTNEPDHVTLSGFDHPGIQGLELLFHEVSHASAFEQPLLGHVAAAFRRAGVEQPPRLSHAIQFVTPAELLRTLLPEGERETVRFIADEMAERRRSRRQYAVVREHWRPFLAGEVSRDVALDGIATDLAR